MSNNSVNILEVLVQTEEFLKKENLGSAEDTSSYSNILEWRPHPKDLESADSCILVLYANSRIAFNVVFQEALIKRISQIAYYRNYLGKWSIVRDLTLLKPAPGIILQFLLENYCSTNDWFGNHIKKLPRIYRGAKFQNPYIQIPYSVKKPQRKRGYDDKGTLRPKDSLSIEYFRSPKTLEKADSYKFDKFILPPKGHFSEENDRKQGTLVERSTSLYKEEFLDNLDNPVSCVDETDKELLFQFESNDNVICSNCENNSLFCFEQQRKKYYQGI